MKFETGKEKVSWSETWREFWIIQVVEGDGNGQRREDLSR